MKRGFYATIAKENIRNNMRLYVPRILAEAGLLGCFYIMLTLAMDSRLNEALGGAYLSAFMNFGAIIIGVLSFVLILYVNSFLMKQRKHEYGLYNVLGLEKNHVIKVLFAESCITSMISIAAGILFGVLFYKACSLLICRLLEGEVVAGFYYLSAPTVLGSAIAFMAMDLMAFFVGAITIRRMKPVELLASSHTGEKEPRIRWFLLLVGVVSITAGYYISWTTKSPLQALLMFFAAVALVILGTYCLFVTGTIFVLKCLKKNKKYYYNIRHMPAVAGLLFRMKRNAVGLASIAVLATGVLVMISTTVSLYSGVEDTVESSFPKQLYLSAGLKDGDNVTPISAEKLCAMVEETSREIGIEIESMETTPMLSVVYLLDGNELIATLDVINLDDAVAAIFITEDTYAKLTAQNYLTTDPRHLKLGKDEIGFCRITSTIRDFATVPESLVIGEKEYHAKEYLSGFPVQSNLSLYVNAFGIVVADEDVLQDIYLAQKEAYGYHASEYMERIGVGFADDAKASSLGSQLTDGILEKLRKEANGQELSYAMSAKWKTKHDILDMYGTFLFLGILLGFVCLFSTILIIYYKQISEGYEDRERFQIMEKIGMEEQEVKKTIGSQLILQFFLPLVTAGIHTAMAFPILEKLLRVLMLTNTKLFILCTFITFSVFAIVYAVVYLLTTKTYYRIVHEGK